MKLMVFSLTTGMAGLLIELKPLLDVTFVSLGIIGLIISIYYQIKRGGKK